MPQPVMPVVVMFVIYIVALQVCIVELRLYIVALRVCNMVL